MNESPVTIVKMSLPDMLRSNLRPRGAAPIVLLRPSNSCGMELRHEAVLEAIADVEKLFVRIQLGDRANALEKIALMLLSESAHIKY